jgi:short-subunit dehydrogenase
MADQRPVALITGASSGIGLELARLFASAGYDLYLAGRNRAALTSLCQQLSDKHAIQADVMDADLAKPGAAQELFKQVVAKNRPIDVLVNSAGVGLRGRFYALEWPRQLEIIQVNQLALVELTSLVLPSMLGRRQGRILNLGALAGFAPGPMMAIYSASNAFVISFSEALSEELIGTGVTLTCLCPAAVATPFNDRAQMQGSLLVKLGTDSAAHVARLGFEGLMAGKPLVVTKFRDQGFLFLLRLLPRRWARIGAKFLLA